MRISRVYFDGTFEVNALLALPVDISHYLNNVLRLRVDDKIKIFNEQHGEYLAIISNITKKEVTIRILEQQREALNKSTSGSANIHLLLGLSRGDRMDFAIQKSTELGAKEISPIYTEHGEVRLKADRIEKKLRHWRKIAISASEQSGRLDVPLLHPPASLSDLDSLNSDATKLMLDPTGSDELPNSINDTGIELLIGPEGGFSSTEIAYAQNQGFKIVSLGSRILRTETAPIAALAILQHKYGDM